MSEQTNAIQPAPAQDPAVPPPSKAPSNDANDDIAPPAYNEAIQPAVVREQYASPDIQVQDTPNGPIRVQDHSSAMVTPLGRLTSKPTHVDCPFCQKRTLTKVSKESTSAQMLAGVLCCMCTLFFTCVPCLCGWCENQDIRCSGCGHKLATLPYDGGIQVEPAPSANTMPSKYATGQGQ